MLTQDRLNKAAAQLLFLTKNVRHWQHQYFKQGRTAQARDESIKWEGKLDAFIKKMENAGIEPIDPDSFNPKQSTLL